MGLYVYRLTQVALVLTNLRILHLRVNSSGKWTRSVKSVQWGDLTSARVRRFIGSILMLEYASGTKEAYWRLRGKDGKKIQPILEAVLSTARASASAVREMVSLCPDCRAVLAIGHYECTQCSLRFKNEATLVWRTLLIPGGAYFYVGDLLPGVIGFLAESFLWLIFAYVAVVALIPGMLEPPSSGQSPDRQAIAGTAGFFLFLVGLHKLIAFNHGRRLVRMFLPTKENGQRR